MAEDKENKDADAEGADGEDGEAPAKKKLAGKTLILFVVLPALLVLGGGAAAFMMMSGGGGETEQAALDEGAAEKAEEPKAKGKPAAKAKGKGGEADDKASEKAAVPPREVGHVQMGEAGEPSYYIMPDILVNLASGDNGRPLFLKLKLTLESVDAHAFDDIPTLLPRITDQFQLFLRELRVDDLNGSAGGYRLRLELLRRLNIAIAPKQVDAVLIEEMLVQ
ncbi:MAG: flagellar basal body-associated FliL family protein [Pseudomonadota bacterium]